MVGVDPGPFVPVDKGRNGRGLTTLRAQTLVAQALGAAAPGGA